MILGSLGVYRQMKTSCLNCSSLTGNGQVSFMEFTGSFGWRWLLYIIPSHPHHQHPLYSCHTEPPRVHRPVSLHRAFPGSGIFLLLCQATCISSCQGGKLLLNTKAWLPTLCWAAYPPTLQAELVMPFRSWNKALYILPIILHLFCLRVCLPNMMRSSWEQGYVFHLHP